MVQNVVMRTQKRSKVDFSGLVACKNVTFSRARNNIIVNSKSKKMFKLSNRDITKVVEEFEMASFTP